MTEIIFHALSQFVDGKTLLILLGLAIIYRKLSTVECGVRSGLLAHITRIHSATVTHGTGFISRDTLQIVTECYLQYKSLGGDGYADHLMNEINALKLR